MLIIGWLLLIFHNHRILVRFWKLPLRTQLLWLPPSPTVCLRCDNLRKQTSPGASCAARTLLCLSLIFGPRFRCLASFFTAPFLVDFSMKTVFWKAAIPSRNLLGDPRCMGLSASSFSQLPRLYPWVPSWVPNGQLPSCLFMYALSVISGTSCSLALVFLGSAFFLVQRVFSNTSSFYLVFVLQPTHIQILLPANLLS